MTSRTTDVFRAWQQRLSAQCDALSARLSARPRRYCTALVALLPALLLGGPGCAEDNRLPSAGDGLTREADVPSCQPGAVRPCGVTVSEQGDLLSCYEGIQTCTDGTWGSCEDGSVVTRQRPRLEDALRLAPRAWANLPCFPPTASGAAGAAGAATSDYQFYNACDPGCRYFDQPAVEEPFGPDPLLDLTVLPDPLTLSGSFGGLSLPGTCVDGLDCQFNQRCTDPALGASCTHDKCVESDAPSAACVASDSCVAAICATPAYAACCDGSTPGAWTSTCVDAVKEVCDSFCEDVPPWHDLCAPGDSLDPSFHPCVATVCALRPSCCDAAGSWDQNCVDLVSDATGCDSYVMTPIASATTASPELCLYAVYAEGNLKLGQRGVLDGRIGTGGNLLVAADTRITGQLDVHGSLQFDGATTSPPNFSGNAVVWNNGVDTGDGTTLQNGSTFEGNLWTRGNLRMVSGGVASGVAVVSGNVFMDNGGTKWMSSPTATAASPGLALQVGGSVTRMGGASIVGDVFSATTPSPATWSIGSWQGPATVADLTFAEPAPLDVVIDPPMPCLVGGVYPTGLPNITLGGATYPILGVLAPGCYGDVTVNSGTLRLGPGVYAFAKLAFNTGSQLRFENVGPSPVSIYVNGGVTMSPESATPRPRFLFLPGDITADAFDPALVNWYFAGSTSINIDQISWVGRIVAPNAAVTVTSQPTTAFNGTVHSGAAVDFEPGAFTLDPTTYATAACQGIMVRDCSIDSTPIPPATGTCESWRDGTLDTTCAGYDLALDVPCVFGGRPQVAVCNHGQGPSPDTGIEISFYDYDATVADDFGTTDPVSAGLTELGTCAVPGAIAPGSCSLVDCDPVSASDAMLMVNPGDYDDPTLGRECSLRENWSLYSDDPATLSCATLVSAPPPSQDALFAECTAGTTPQWMFLTWDAELADGASIDFEVRTGTRNALGTVDVWSAPVTYTAENGTSTPESCTVFSAASDPSLDCPVVLENDLGFPAGDAIRVDVTMNAGVGPSTLHQWNLTHTCVDYQ
jgi:hypothetical protein